jgi:hypothetical protein
MAKKSRGFDPAGSPKKKKSQPGKSKAGRVWQTEGKGKHDKSNPR